MRGQKKFSNPIVILFNGILMGTANKIPGISGGLVALALGFYKDLIEDVLSKGHEFRTLSQIHEEYSCGR